MGYYYGIGGEFYLIAFVFAAISMIVSQRLKSKFKTYSKIQLRNGLSVLNKVDLPSSMTTPRN